MSLRFRALGATVFLLVVFSAGALVILDNLRGIVENQRLIVFKDGIYHNQQRAQRLIQSAQSRLYQHQAGYTRDIDLIVEDIGSFEKIIAGIGPRYRQYYRERDCNSCHENALESIEKLDETVRQLLISLDRYRESVSIIITTNDRQARLLHNGIANANGEEMLAMVKQVNTSVGLMIERLRARNERLLRRSSTAIKTSVGAVALIFVTTLGYALWASGRIFSSLLRGTESMTRDDFAHRLPLADRHDEIGLLAARFNLMAKHLQERDRQVREKTLETEEANRRLYELNETLEEKVVERTQELQTSIEQLRITSAALEDSKRRLETSNQNLLRSNQAKANFLSIISHELKTPLSVINGFLSLVLDERYHDDPQHLREAMQIARRRGEQLSRMIDELIDLARLDARAMVLRLEETDVGGLLRDLAAEFQEECRRRGVRLSLRLEEGLPRLLCDPDKLQQVFTNLLGNALKFSPEGGEIELGAESRGEEVLFTCRDTGIGIPVGELGKVFDKFYQVDSSATRRFGGAGLGLSIVKEIVLLHGGRAWVESTPGHGSTFFVLLPKHPPRAAGNATPQVGAAPPA